MKSPPLENLTETWERNNNLAHRFVVDITQAESLLRPPVAGNCMNWVLGHILENRDNCLKLLGQEPVLSEEETQTYRRGSEALVEPGAASDIAALIEKMDASLQRLTASIQALPAGGLETEVYYNKLRPLGEALNFLQWHETYHLGQLDPLRQLAGKTEKIIG